jgi:hypothetical protein
VAAVAAMPRWPSILLAVLSALFALQQVRMFRIYRGQIHSSTIGQMQPNPTLSAIAIRSAVTFAVFAVLFLLVPWPRVLTYITGVWVFRAVVDVFLCWLGRGQFSVTAPMLTEKGQRAFVLNSAAKVVGNGVWFGVCIYFFGF